MPTSSRAALADAYALAGDKEKAIATAQPLENEKDVSLAVDFFYTMAEIGALFSDKEMAFKYLTIAAQTPSSLTYGEMKFSPLWDEFRSDPRFGKIMDWLAPKETLQ